jgi:hypothetical protein
MLAWHTMPRLRQYGRTHTKHTPPVGHPKLCKWGRQHQTQHTRSPHTHLSKVTLMGHGACLACQTLLRHQTMPMQLGLATNCTDAKTTPLPIAVDNTALCFQHLIRLTHRHTPQRHRHTTLASQKPHLADARTNTHKSTMALATSPRRLGPCKGDTHCLRCKNTLSLARLPATRTVNLPEPCLPSPNNTPLHLASWTHNDAVTSMLHAGAHTQLGGRPTKLLADYHSMSSHVTCLGARPHQARTSDSRATKQVSET